MTEDFKKTIIDFAKVKLKRDDLEFKVQSWEHHNNKIFLILVVDCEKMDVNSGKFDKSYYDLLTREGEEKPRGFYFRFDDEVLSTVTNYFKKYMNIDMGHWFHYKNYDYLDTIENEIEKAISKSSMPEVDFEFSGSGESPKLRLTLYNLSSDVFNHVTEFDEFISELESLMGNKYKLDSYNIARTMGSKK